MKIRFTILVLLFTINFSFAQKSASVTWNLSSTDSQKVSQSVGDVEAKKEVISAGPNGMVVASYNSNGQRLNQGAFGWKQETVHNDSRFIQFEVSPSAGNNLTVSKVSFNYGFAGSTSAMNSNVFYSTDNWNTRTQMNSDIGALIYGNSIGANYSKDLNVTVPNGTTFSVRIYPYWVISTTTSTTKYAVHNTFIISGSTTPAQSDIQLSVSTNNVAEITDVSALCGGIILTTGGKEVVDKGICWSTNPLPTLNENKVSAGNGLGGFSIKLNSLQPKTKYYVRAYATNSDGAIYGNEISFNTTASLIPAFSGADGFGKFTTGGRGGTVYEVTNLNDDNLPGSLRYAVNQTGTRTIVFKTSGTIYLKSSLTIKNGNLTIAGQTAPGDGICLAGYTLTVNASNVIIRYIRTRLGDVNRHDDDAMNGRNVNNLMVDHCSISWSVDEDASFYGLTNSTIQWCLISESLNLSLHVEDGVLQEHGYGGIMGGKNTTIHHNLFAHHNSRNPRFSGGETDICENADFRNNVLYNWGNNSIYGGEKGKINIINNYYKYGPATSSSKRYRVVEPSDTVGRWFVAGNYVFGNPTITANNWSGGVQGNYVAYQSSKKPLTAFPYLIEKEESAEKAFERVMKHVGASFPKRDPLDLRIIEEARTGTAKYGTRFGGGGKGIIDSQNDVGGWPELKSTAAPVDTDKDGMPDDWETAKGLNPNDKTDGNKLNAEGYTMLEVYLDELVASTFTEVKKEETIPVGYKLEQNFPNPFNPETTIGYKVQASSNVSLKVYDVLGREVATLVNNYHPAGTYKVAFNVDTRRGAQLQSGVYFYRMQTPSYTETKKMLLVK